MTVQTDAPATAPDAPTGSTGPDEGTPAPTTAKVFDEAYVGELRREAAKYRTSAKAAEDALEAARKEAEEARSGLPTLESRATTAEERALRLEVALDKGLPKAFVARLQGSTREEMEADADTLMALVTPAAPVDPLGYGGGSNTEAPPAKANVNQALRVLAGFQS